jgi:hypothetical protein
MLRVDGFIPKDLELEMCIQTGDQFWVREIGLGSFDLPEVSGGISDKLTMAVLRYVSNLMLDKKSFKFVSLIAGGREDRAPTADHNLLKELVDSVSSNQAIE